MFFNHNISLKSLLGTAASVATVLGGLTSCVQIEDGCISTEGKAYIAFSPVTLDYEVEGIMSTKANVPAEDMPGQEDFTIRISGQGIEDIVIAPGDLTSEPLVVDAGTYTVDAYYGSNSFAGPYFHKSETVELVAGVTKTISLTDIPLANAMIALVLPEGISQHLDLNSLQVTDGENSVDVEPGKYVYAPSGKAVTAKFAGTNSLGEPKDISYSLGILESKRSYTVTCNLNLPSVSITLPDQQDGAWATRLYVTPATVVTDLATDKLLYEAIEASSSDWSSAKKSEVIDGVYHVIKGLTNGASYKVRARLGAFCSEERQVTVKAQLDGASVSASHTYSSSVLTGSKATANIGLPSSGILKTLYDAGLLTISGGVLKYGSTQVRTLSGLSGDMTAVSGWPYLPKGTGYAFEVSHRCLGDTEDVKSSIAPIEVPAPTFTVGVSAETSYSRYQNYKNGVSGYTLELANTSGTGDRVMNIKGNVTISNDILGSSNYSSLISASLKYDGLNMLTSPAVTSNVFAPNTLENNTGLLSGSDVISQSTGSHTVAATFVFDGVPASNATASKQCDVTGIPYYVDCPNANTISGWTSNNTGKSYSKLCINEGDGYLHSNSDLFYIPDAFNIKITVPAHGYHSNALTVYAYDPLVYIGATNTPGKVGSSTKANVNINPGTYEDTNYTNVVRTFQLTPSVPRICIYGENKERGADTRQIRLKNISVIYSD